VIISVAFDTEANTSEWHILMRIGEDPLTEVSARPRYSRWKTGASLTPRGGRITRRGGKSFSIQLTGSRKFSPTQLCRQIVCLTYPHIGNVGANVEDEESSRPYIESLIVREFSQVSSNWSRRRRRNCI